MTRYQRTNFDHLTPEQRQSEPSPAASLLWHLGSGLGQSCLKGSVFSREDLYQTAQAHNQHFGAPPITEEEFAQGVAELLECGWFTESPRIFFEALPLSDGHVKLHVDGQLLEGPQEHFRNLARALLNPQEFHRTLPFAVHRLSALGGGGVMLDIQGFRTDLSGQEAQELGEGLQSIVSGLPQRPGIYLASGQLVSDDSEDIEYHIGAFDTIEQAKATCTRHAREQFGQVSGEPEDTPVDQDSQLDLDFAASEHTSNVWTADDGGHLHYTIAYFELNARYA